MRWRAHPHAQCADFVVAGVLAGSSFSNEAHVVFAAMTYAGVTLVHVRLQASPSPHPLYIV